MPVPLRTYNIFLTVLSKKLKPYKENNVQLPGLLCLLNIHKILYKLQTII